MKHKEGQKPYLSLKGIDRFFGITKALQKVDLDIYEGEVIGLVGPNGAGKSTMMKILTGVLPKTAGQIIYNGVPEENYNAKIDDETIKARESWWKEILQTKKYGYNDN